MNDENGSTPLVELGDSRNDREWREAVLVNDVPFPLDGIGYHNLVSQLIKKPGGTHAPGAGCLDATP